MSDFIKLQGKTIIIIGASSGIGKATAIKLSQLGVRLVLVARRKDKLYEVQQALSGSGHTVYQADVSNSEEVEALFKSVKNDVGSVDGLVYSAGVNSIVPLSQLKPKTIKAVFDINFFGFIETVRQVTRRGRFNDGMRIVAVSSIASTRGDKAHTAYSSSKAALDAAVRCLAKELADKGICINTVAPAMTNTEIYQQYVAQSGMEQASTSDLHKRQYLGIIEPEDVASAIVYLLSPSARPITGIMLPVDGGLSTS